MIIIRQSGHFRFEVGPNSDVLVSAWLLSGFFPESKNMHVR